MPFDLTPSSLATGGTIFGNLVITGTLNVQGAVTFDVAQTTTGLFNAEGGILIDETGTEVFLVRQEADAGDVFAINTTTPGVLVTGTLGVSGATTIQGITIIDLDGTEVFLVRKDGDGGDVFAIDADNGIVAITGSLTISTPLVVANGGIGVGTLTDGGILLGSGTSALTALARGTAGQMLIGSTSGDPVMGTLAGTANEVAITTGDGTLQVGLATNIIVSGTFGVTGTTTLDGVGIIDITNTEAFLVRQNSDAADVFAVDTTNKRTLVGSLTATDQTFETLPEAFSVAEGNLEVLNSATLGAETITDGGFPNSTNWAGATDWSDTISGTTIYTHSAGSGTLTQTAAQRVTGNEGSNARWYKVTYTLTSVTNAGAMVLTVTNAFAAAAVTLPVTANGTFSVIFQSHATTADTADFVMAVAGSAASDTFTMDNLILKEIIGGDIILGGKLTGGGTKGLQVGGGGTVYTFEEDLGTVGATQTIDWRDGNHQKLTLDENLTLTFIDPDGPTNLIAHFVQDAGATNTVAWPANVDWEGGTAPVITATNGAIDIVTLYFDGSRYFGGFLQDFS